MCQFVDSVSLQDFAPRHILCRWFIKGKMNVSDLDYLLAKVRMNTFLRFQKVQRSKLGRKIGNPDEKFRDLPRFLQIAYAGTEK